MSEDLKIHESLLLLGLHDEKGTARWGTSLNIALGAGILSELLLAERLELVPAKKNPMIEVRDATPTGDPLLDEALNKVGSAKRRASAQTWVSRMGSPRNLSHRLADRLCERGVLREEQRKFLLVFSQTVYPEQNPGPERQLIEQLRQAIFTDAETELRTAAVVAIAHATGILTGLFDKKELKARKERIGSILEDRPAGQAALAAVQAVQAVMVATTAATIATTTVIHS